MLIRRPLVAMLLALASTLPAVAQPVTSHPRLWIKQNDIPRLRAWATSSNPIWTAMQTSTAYAVGKYNAGWSGGAPVAGKWNDDGSVNWVGDCTEAYAEYFAFLSLVDPASQAARDAHAQRARTMLMYEMNEAAKGQAAGQPYRDPVFATYNRANYWSEAFPVTVDWIYPYLSSSDKATIRTVFLMWANDLLNASTAGNEHPQPVGVTNDLQLIGSGAAQSPSQKQAAQLQFRWTANNYFAGHARLLTMMALALDPADDPGGQLTTTFLSNATGAWLYQQYAMFEDPSITMPALGIPAGNHSIGLASGGMPVEGFLYGESLGYLHQELLALHTSGYDTPALSGPQADLIRSVYWDRVVDGQIESLTPAPFTPSAASGFSYLGPLYQPADYGDTLRFYYTYGPIDLFGPLATYDYLMGNTARLQKERFAILNFLQGGYQGLLDRTAQPWGNSSATDAIFTFLSLDPTVAAPADPRPSMPNYFLDPQVHRVLARTSFNTTSTWFNYRCSWETINHQVGDCNQFELHRNGEWLIHQRSGYGNDFIFYTPDYHNTLAIQNTVSSGGTAPPTNLGWFETETWNRGGQWTNGNNAGDPSGVESVGAGYAYAQSIATNLYNRPDIWDATSDATDVTHASRSILWLEPDTVVVYDRATTKTANRFKRFWLSLLAMPSISGKTATLTSAGGQKLFVQSLLPQNATLTVMTAENFNSVAELEPTTARLMIEDATNPTNVRFLTVIDAADAGSNMPARTAITSTGTPFDGVTAGTNAIFFPVDLATPFSSLVFTVPANTINYVSGLTPGGGYDALLSPAGGGVQITVTPGTQRTADSAGVLVFSAGPYMHGDVNGDGQITGADVVYLVNYLFAGGPAPIGSGDVNADNSVSSTDVFYLMNYLFAAGPAPM